MIAEWNEYFNYELEVLSKAICGAFLSTKTDLASEPIKDPDKKAAIFDQLGAKSG